MMKVQMFKLKPPARHGQLMRCASIECAKTMAPYTSVVLPIGLH